MIQIIELTKSPEMKKQDILVVKRKFTAPVERVFDAWTNPEVIAKWFGPEDFTVTRSSADLIVGGAYEIEILSLEGNSIKHYGIYLEISAPNKLGFTWVLENQACVGSKNQCAETLVSIDFKDLGKTTELTLTHERLPSKEAYDGHQFGWNSSLDSLATYLK